MGRIKIDDLPEEQKISKEIMKKVMGGDISDYQQLTAQIAYQQLAAQIAYAQADIEIRMGACKTLEQIKSYARSLLG